MPSSFDVRFSQICIACVGTVVTCSHIARHSGRASSSSPQMWGRAPMEMPSTTRSKSSPARIVFAPTGSHAVHQLSRS